MSRRNAPAVVVRRGELVESRHAIRIVVTDASGRMQAGAGDPRANVFLRSAAKPFQAAAALASGALGRIGVSEEELAVICASHSGEEIHVRLVTALLARMGLDESALRCGSHPPIDPAAAARVGAAASPLHNNCSGKHAGMLALARHLGAPPESYLEPDGIVQRRIFETVAALCGIAPAKVVRAIDGCSAPVFAVPLANAARAWARLARPDHAPAGLSGPLERIARAMAAHPHLVAGTGRFDTRLMTAAAGRLVAKAGAESVQGIADRDSGLGLFLKVEDGAARAAAPAVIEAIRQLGWASADALAALEDLRRPAVANHAGIVVGHVEPDFVLQDTPHK